MIKQKFVFLHLLALFLIPFSAFLHIVFAFCNMRGPHPKDMCDALMGSYWNVAMSLHGVLAVLIIAHLLLYFFLKKQLLSGYSPLLALLAIIVSEFVVAAFVLVL